MIIDPSVIRQVSREKDIDPEKMFGALEEAMSSAARKFYHDKAVVTSIDRKLYSLDDAVRFVGRRIQVKSETPVEPEYLGQARGALSPARNFSGRLESVDEDRLRVVDEAGRRIYNVRFGDIRSARLDYEWPERR